VNGGIPIAELMLEQIDARSGLDRLEACLPWLEKVYASWQREGGAANFPLIVAAATPRGATIFHSAGWADADDCCTPELARQAVLAAIEAPPSTKNTDIIAAGLSLLLGPKGRARQQRDAAAIRKAGSVPLVVALLAPGSGDDIAMLTTTIAVVPRVLH
jgi:hypothetical protein